MLKASLPKELYENSDLTHTRCGAWHMIGAQQMCVQRSTNEYVRIAYANYQCKDSCTVIFFPQYKFS